VNTDKGNSERFWTEPEKIFNQSSIESGKQFKTPRVAAQRPMGKKNRKVSEGKLYVGHDRTPTGIYKNSKGVKERRGSELRSAGRAKRFKNSRLNQEWGEGAQD